MAVAAATAAAAAVVVRVVVARGPVSLWVARRTFGGGRRRRGEKVWTGTLAPFIKSLARAIRNQTKEEAGLGGRG